MYFFYSTLRSLCIRFFLINNPYNYKCIFLLRWSIKKKKFLGMYFFLFYSINFLSMLLDLTEYLKYILPQIITNYYMILISSCHTCSLLWNLFAHLYTYIYISYTYMCVYISKKWLIVFSWYGIMYYLI